MMKQRIATLVLVGASLLATAPTVNAQEAKRAERERTYQRYLEFASLVKGGTVQANWMADGHSFWYAEGAPDQTVIYKVDPKTNTKSPLFDAPRLRAALRPVLGHEPAYQGLPFERMTFVDGEKAVKFTIGQREFILQLDSYAITTAPALSEAEKYRMAPQVVRRGLLEGVPDVMEMLSPDRSWFATIKDYNLWARSTNDGRSEPVTTDGIKDYGWELEGARWSPDSFKLAIKKVDSRNTLSLPVVHWLRPTEEVEWFRYSKAGGPIPQEELFVVDLLSKRQVKVDTGAEPDHLILLADWRSDSSELYFVRFNREYRKAELTAANPTNGASRVILTETQKPFLQISGPTLLADGERFIWPSERDGWNHLYLYDLNGNLIRQLTQGAFPVIQVAAVDEKRGWVYFTANSDRERPYDTHLHRVNLEGREFTRLTEAKGEHSLTDSFAAPDSPVGIQFSPSKEFFLDTHSSTDRPPTVELRSADGKLLQVLSQANVDALKELKWSPPEEFSVKAADQKTDLYGVLYKPFDFDPGKKYPVIENIYNGPQITTVPRIFTERRGIWAQALAQLGFIVFIVDGRGTPERGKEFQDVVYRNFGRNEIPDHVATLKQLAARRPCLDTSRVGIFGGSWGGYMTIRALLLAPDVYQVGVSSYPVVDLYDHLHSAIEYYMGLPQNNREGYEYGSSLRLAGNLKGKLLLIHGTSDVNATFSSTMKMVEALVRAGKPYDLIILPDQTHAISGVSRTYWMEAIRRYFEEHLRPYPDEAISILPHIQEPK